MNLQPRRWPRITVECLLIGLLITAVTVAVQVWAYRVPWGQVNPLFGLIGFLGPIGTIRTARRVERRARREQAKNLA